MSWDKTLDKVNGQLEKAKEFRYFALLASFVFFLDSTLILLRGEPLSRLSYSSLATDIPLGQVLLFFALFTFFMSFIVPLVQVLLSLLSFAVPYKVYDFFYSEQWKDKKPKDYFRLHQLKRYAVRTGNAVAYDYYKSLVTGRHKDALLNYFCLALVLAVSMNAYAYMWNDAALFAALIYYFTDNNVTFGAGCVSLSLWALIAFCLYFGIIRGCGFSLTDNDKFYFPNHEFGDS